MQVKDLIQVLESVAPPHLQESYDNAGLIVGHPESELTGALFCLDSTEAIIEEAIRKNCNMVIAHHPIVFKGLKKINGYSYVERTVIQAIRNDIAVYAIHTNLDNVYHRGVNERIARKIGLTNTRILRPVEGTEGIGSGMIGQLEAPMAEKDFLIHAKQALKTACIRHTSLRGKEVKTVAVCGGAGSFLLQDALRQGADAFVSADFKYHEFFDAEGKLVIADVGHFESEQFTIDLLYEIIQEKFPNFALHCTETHTNPVNYLL